MSTRSYLPNGPGPITGCWAKIRPLRASPGRGLSPRLIVLVTLTPDREMSCVSLPLSSWIFRYLLRILSTQEQRWDLPALAFLLEVSLMASSASLCCLPALCPLVATAAWDGARVLCCSLGPALCSSGLLLAMSPVTALCLSGPEVPGLE